MYSLQQGRSSRLLSERDGGSAAFKIIYLLTKLYLTMKIKNLYFKTDKAKIGSRKIQNTVTIYTDKTQINKVELHTVYV